MRVIVIKYFKNLRINYALFYNTCITIYVLDKKIKVNRLYLSHMYPSFFYIIIIIMTLIIIRVLKVKFKIHKWQSATVNCVFGD
jgi:hypothetical protein